MVLNTSFNVMGEPIVDSPQGAVRSDDRGSKATVLLERVVGPNGLPTTMKHEKEQPSTSSPVESLALSGDLRAAWNPVP